LPPTDVLRTREALVAYSIGLTGLILVKVLAPGFYARQDIRTPVKIALFTLAADTTDEPRLHRLAQARRAGAVDRAGLLLQRRMLWRGLRRSGRCTSRSRLGAFTAKLLARCWCSAACCGSPRVPTRHGWR
jgi:putative peptidoglycan lipid II flippase